VLRAVLFDLDGTLMDHDAARLAVHVADHRGAKLRPPG
jgi:FMN phosphatase YigB (HAD superfamily)